MLLFYFSELSSLLVMDAWHSQLQLKFQRSKKKKMLVMVGFLKMVLMCFWSTAGGETKGESGQVAHGED